jgi:hypothetical protein
VLVCVGPNDAKGKRGPCLSLAKLKSYPSFQDVIDKRFTKENLLVQGYVAKYPMPSRPMVVTNKRSALGPLEATFNNQVREVVNEYVVLQMD